MAGLNRYTPTPTEINLHQQSRLVEISFADGTSFKMSYDFLHVFSPSAEVRGHGPALEVLQTGKRDVLITSFDALGNYAVKPVFSNGHDAGIYPWDLLYELGAAHDEPWQGDLDRLAACGGRDVDRGTRPPRAGGQDALAHGGGCGHKH